MSASTSVPRERVARRYRQPSYARRLWRDIRINRHVYIMLLPVVAYYLIFHYGPIYGVQIAFKAFSPTRGFLGSPWVGFDYFKDFFNSYYFGRLLKNTLLLSLYELLFAFPAAVVLALLLNEVRRSSFKRLVQTVTYLPHFISIVIISGMLIDFLSRDGLVNQLLTWTGREPAAFLSDPAWFRTVYIASGIWQNVGWGSIIYLAAISAIDPTLYEAAKVDGAGRFRQVLNVTIPGILPTVIIMLILQIGSFMAVGTDKILLLYNSSTYETADVIGTYVYRRGILDSDFSYSAAVGLFNSVINFALLILANRLSRRYTETKLW
ncbi:ABC transporter permease subunit [Paenibacillus aurantius]|uniref:ABC transporter permease subunit n=1 Tax=Paenibacillus aurantius TaxID=2918900 RepID=A0AA96RFD5_9BACL|nr:ABC transporter permease subunit [Paenibacillus aurantius]WNQ11862.1 ABC transporter permease subunit [Paenibacillus aurantius]